jgi:hypothetical protein
MPMSLTINLPPELEQQLRHAADREGTDPGTYLVQVVARALAAAGSGSPALLPVGEGSLLQEINLGISVESWERYHQLVELRRAETLTEVEQRELITLSDQIESANARRVEQLALLARQRGTTVWALRAELGITSATQPRANPQPRAN